MMDTRQHSGGAMPSNSLQFSPQSALSNENFFLLDEPNLSPSSPPMELGGWSTPFSSHLTSDFSSVFMESASQNAFGSSMGGNIQGQTSSSILPADEWSGTTNSTLGESSSLPHPQQQQGNRSSLYGSLTQSGLLNMKLPVQPSYDNSMVASSQTCPDAFGVQQHLINRAGESQGSVLMSTHGRAQGTMQQPTLQGSQISQHTLLQNHAGIPDGFFAQQSGRTVSMNAFDVQSQGSQDNGFQGMNRFNQQGATANIHRVGIRNNLQAQHASSQSSTAQRAESEMPAKFAVPNAVGAFYQLGHGGNACSKIATGTHSTQQVDQNMQVMRGLAMQLQEKLPQAVLQTQLRDQYTTVNSPNLLSNQQTLLQAQGTSDQLNSFQSQAISHQLSALLQSQSSHHLQSVVQSQLQDHAQTQGTNQQTAPQQSIYQAQQLQSGGQQNLLLAANQSNSFHATQTVANQLQSASCHNMHLGGAQPIAAQMQPMPAQMQPRLLNTIFQNIKAGGGQHSLQRSLGFGNATEGNGRTQMPGAIASRCIQVLMRYIQEQRKRPKDNDIVFWRNLVKDFFVPGATKRWCLSSYNASPMGKHAQGLFPMDYWFCNLCGTQPGRGFASSTDVLPRLFKIKYASGLVDEFLFLDVAEERYMLPNGRLVLEFQRAVHESIFPELRVVRYGRLRVTFSSSFKIFSWEFCTKIHEEVVPRKSLLHQAQQLAKLVMEAEQGGFDKSAGNLKAHCNEFTGAAKQLASKLEAPSVNDLGFSKRYVRCLQIAEVVNSMKDLISFEKKTGFGPIMSLAKFPTIRKMPEGLLAQSTLSQLINQLTQTNAGTSAMPYPRRGQQGNHIQPGHLESADSAAALPLKSIKQEAQDGGLPHQQQQQQRVGAPFNLTHSQLQIYESAGHKQIGHHPPHQHLLSHSQHSLNHPTPHSLPTTPQSEMSDMRSNA